MDGPAISSKLRLKRQIDVAAEVVGKLALKLYSDEFKAVHVSLLQSLIEHGKTIVDEVRGAALARTEARLDIRAWKDNANAIRLANYGELVAIAARAGRKKDWADAFFLSVKTSSVDDVEEQDEAEVPEEAQTG